MTPAEMCAHLIRFDTSNYGGGESNGETPLAEEIVRLLQEAGYDPQLVARVPHRASVVVRVTGSRPDQPALLVHGHLDVVPAEPEQWSVPPFSGLIQDGYVYGRGAIDMKDMVANMVCTLLDWAREGITPRRDIVFAFVADEEDHGEWGAEWLVTDHPELLQGVGAAIGESGGSATLLERADGAQVTLYPVAVAERGTLHLRLTARGTSGHGSRPTADSAITRLLGAAHRINNHRWPLVLTDAVRRYITEVNAAVGHGVELDSEAGVERAIDQMGPAGQVAGITVRCSATTTVLKAGYKTNVIPGVAEAEVDVRCLPGTFDDTLATMIELIGPEVESEVIDPGHPTDFSADSPWFGAIRAAILRHDPAAVVVPYCMGGGTDAKSFARLGAECFGFAPRTLDPDGRLGDGMHGVDERVPVASVNGGQAILSDFLRAV
ncbi:MAG: M20/M25/M40 family metallo-hydrolase [Propionibacteriaceae bacterium]